VKPMTKRTAPKQSRCCSFACGILGIFLFTPSPLQAGAMTDQIRAAVEKVVAIFQDPHLKPDARKNERQTKLREAIEPNFDFEEMAKRSLGSHWQSRSPEEQARFVTLFTNLLEASYLDKIESYVGEKFLYLRETQEGGFSEVATKIIDQGEEVAINYKLHSADGSWKIYDVLIENISLVNNYRSQLNRILATASFDELLQRLQEKRGKEFGSERLRLNTIVSYSIISAAVAARSR
jgi:phospholipid transport system substrate-binding protein